MRLLGIDIGGSGVKGAVVDARKGVFVTDRLRLETPRPGTPEALSEVVDRITQHFEWNGPIGMTFPGVVTHGRVRTAANLDSSWIDIDARRHFIKATGCPVALLNDADAAAVAEQAFGAARKVEGVVVMVTLGTGIGTALINDGVLVPNLELGHLQLHGADAEQYAAASAREREGLSFEEWADRLSEYFSALEDLLWPDQFVIGGGVSKNPDAWLPKIRCRTPLIPARLRNKAGIVGAALYAEREHVAARTWPSA
jgi:polyphosphate glucokinase